MKAKFAAMTVTLALIGSGGAAAVSGGGPAEEQIFSATRDRQVITGKSWQMIRPLTLSTDCTDRPAATATLSLQLKGPARQVQVRIMRTGVTVVGEKGRPMAPGVVGVRKPRGNSALVFSFVRRSVVDGHGENFQVQVRSPSGRRLVVQKGSLVVVWDPASGACE